MKKIRMIDRKFGRSIRLYQVRQATSGDGIVAQRQIKPDSIVVVRAASNTELMRAVTRGRTESGHINFALERRITDQENRIEEMQKRIDKQDDLISDLIHKIDKMK